MRLQAFGPPGYEPIPVGLLEAIADCPRTPAGVLVRGHSTRAPLDPQLLSIDAHTGHRVVPMCFEADSSDRYRLPKASADCEPTVPDGLPSWRCIRMRPPSHPRQPSTAFLKDRGIDYIYADARHPNTLVDEAILVAKSGAAEILRVP